MRFGIQIRPNKPPDAFVAHLRLAEEQGFDFAWIADVGLHREVFIMSALGCQATTKIKIGPGVVNPYTRHPAILATEAATLQEISHGRAFLGLGTGGYSALRQLGFPTWDRPAITLREAVVLCRQLLDEGAVNFEGSVFQARNAKIDFAIRQRIPIYLGVMLGKNGLKLAGQLCDGALTVGPLGKTHTKYVVDQIIQAAKEAHRRSDDLEIAMATPFAVSDNGPEAVKVAKQAIAELAILDPRLRPVLNAEGVTDDQILDVRQGALRGDISAVTDEMVELFGIAGTPTYCVEKIAALRKSGITQIAIGRPARENQQMMRIIGTEIIPSLT